MARRPVRNWQVVFALRERGEAGDVLVVGDQLAGIMASVAAEVVLRHFDPAFADRRGAQQIDREPPEVCEAFVRRSAFDRLADQRRGRAGVLVVGMPGAAGEAARAKDPLADLISGRHDLIVRSSGRQEGFAH